MPDRPMLSGPRLRKESQIRRSTRWLPLTTSRGSSAVAQTHLPSARQTTSRYSRLRECQTPWVNTPASGNWPRSPTFLPD